MSSQAFPHRRLGGASAASHLARDEGGAIMVLGIFMCATLVGATWYIAGIGDAIVHRERLQEAADAAAMSAAVLNARGMNLLVFLNLIMACVLAIRVALKTLQATLIILETIFGGCALVPMPFNPLQGFCITALPFTTDGIELSEDLIEDTRDPINSTLEGLHKAQGGIARVVPGASVLGAREVIGKYSPFIEGESVATPSFTRLKEGLPVEDGSTDKLCKEAGNAMGALMDTLNPIKIPALSGMFSEAMGWIAEKGSGYFCELGGSGGPPDFSDVTAKGAAKRCQSEVEKRQQALLKKQDDWHKECGAAGVTCLDEVPIDPFNPDGGTKSEMSGPKFDALQKSTKPEDKATLGRLNSTKDERDRAKDDLDSFRVDQCRAQEKKALDDKMKKMPAGQQGSGNGKEPMKVKADWFNGCAEGQTLSFLTARDDLLKRGPKGVRIGAQKDKRGQIAIDVPMGASSAYAQAEYFYDCSGAWSSCNDDQEAMWHLRWRARLRRYNKPDWKSPSPAALLDTFLDGALLWRGGEMKFAAGAAAARDPLNFSNGARAALTSVSDFKLH